ncbi:MAG: hypothetical protein RR538_07210 [Erysipelotrichaceae bacterium]
MQHARGKHILIFAGLIEILFGAASIGLVYWKTKNGGGDSIVLGMDIAKNTMAMFLVYGIGAVQVISGFTGLIFSNRSDKAGICLFFGFLLVVVTLAAIPFRTNLKMDPNTMMEIGSSLLIPCFYLYGANKNKNS